MDQLLERRGDEYSDKQKETMWKVDAAARKDYNAKLPLKDRIRLPHNSLRCLMHTLDGVEAIVDEDRRELIIQGGVTDEINEILSICGIKTFAALGREALSGDEDGLIVDEKDFWGV